MIDVNLDGTVSAEELYLYFHSLIGMLVALLLPSSYDSLAQYQALVESRARASVLQFFKAVTGLREDQEDLSNITLDEFVMAVTNHPELFFLVEILVGNIIIY